MLSLTPPAIRRPSMQSNPGRRTHSKGLPFARGWRGRDLLGRGEARHCARGGRLVALVPHELVLVDGALRVPVCACIVGFRVVDGLGVGWMERVQT